MAGENQVPALAAYVHAEQLRRLNDTDELLEEWRREIEEQMVKDRLAGEEVMRARSQRG